MVGHEFWIEPEQYQVDIDTPIVAHFRNGQEFKGISLGFFSRQSLRFDLITGDGAMPITARMGDVPALGGVNAPRTGLAAIVHETAPSTISYKTWDKFQTFADHKAFEQIRERHFARGLPEADFTETYRRFAKALVVVGDGAGRDAPSGMETEFVALTNPYAGAVTSVHVRLLYQGQPRASAQVEVFDKDPAGDVTITYLTTDAAGETHVPVRTGHSYLLDAVVLRPAPDGEAPVWETLWAALTFAIP